MIRFFSLIAVLFMGQLSFAASKRIENVNDCRAILTQIPTEKPLEELRRSVIAFVRNAPIGGNAADRHLPIVRHTEALGVSAIDNFIHVPFRVLYTERLFGKHHRDRVFVANYNADTAIISVSRPDSVVEANGSISGAVPRGIVPVLTRLQLAALDQAELGVPELENSYIAGMDIYDLGKKHPNLMRITIGSLQDEGANTKSYSTHVIYSSETSTVRRADHLIPERTAHLPAQPQQSQKETQSEKLKFIESQSLEENLNRAALTKIADDEIHFGDDVGLEVMGHFNGKQGETIGVVLAHITKYDNQLISVYYTVVVNNDHTMAVQRDIYFDEEGDSIRPDSYVGEAERSAHRFNLKGLLTPEEFSPAFSAERVRAIGYAKSEPSKHYILIRGTYSSLANERNEQGQLKEIVREFVGAIEMHGNMIEDNTKGLILGSGIRTKR